MRMSLKVRLILSHTLPVLILAPFFSFYLVSSLRTFYYDRLKDDLQRSSQILAATLQDDPSLTSDPARLQQIMNNLNIQSNARVQIIGSDGTILASTEPADAPLIGTVSQSATVKAALQGKTSQAADLSNGDIATAAAPIAGGRQGVVRMSLQLVDVEQTFNRLNLLILAAMTVFTLLSLGIGSALGSALAFPLRQLARDAKAVAQGDYTRRIDVGDDSEEIAELANSFNGMVEQLAEQREARERMLADVAHELRRPMGALQSAAEVLRDGNHQEPHVRTKLLDGLYWEMARLGRLTNRLTLAARDGAGPALNKCADVDVAAVASRVVTLFAPEAARQGIELNCEMPGERLLIQADEDALIEVFTNLLDNALKFTPRGGRVLVSMGAADDHVWVEVADTGMGLTLEEQKQLFKRFYRGDQARARPHGIGLGLAIANELIQAHGGAINVSSQPDQGAAFRVEIPR
jgi:signal transduction histidine kinase